MILLSIFSWIFQRSRTRAFSSFVIMGEIKIVIQIDWCGKRKWECSKVKHHRFPGKGKEGAVCGSPMAGTLGCLCYWTQFCVGQQCAQLQAKYLLSLSVARNGHVTCLLPMRHEKNSTQVSGKLPLLFPFSSCLEDVRMLEVEQHVSRRGITVMSVLLLSCWTIPANTYLRMSNDVTRIPHSVLEPLWLGFLFIVAKLILKTPRCRNVGRIKQDHVYESFLHRKILPHPRNKDNHWQQLVKKKKKQETKFSGQFLGILWVKYLNDWVD